MLLHNRVNKEDLKKRLMEEPFRRITLSFYRYIIIHNTAIFRDQLYSDMAALNVFGRIYVAHEGINAQISVPEHHWEEFKAYLESNLILKNVPLKIAVEDDGKSFYKLNVKIRVKLVADGLDDDAFDVTNVGRHLDAVEFNEITSREDAVLVDMRNHYESEIGHFEGAVCPDADTFREELPLVLNMLEDKKDQPIVLYCTGGIRCEKASAFLKHHGFKNVNQLYGGIIAYASQVKESGLENKFRGKNFVFDERLGERISEEIISQCHQCGKAADTHTNCANSDCHLLFIQCSDCAEAMKGCCSDACFEFIQLPLDQQKALRKGKKDGDNYIHHKSRLRPKLRELKRS
jgi:UPF0176 protein